MNFTKVLDGISSYIDNEIFPGMSDWQQVIARIAIGRVYENRGSIEESLSNNGVIRAFKIIDEDGNVDVERLMKDLRNEISRKGKLEIKIPMFGKLTFAPEDVDVLHKTIEGDYYEDN